MKMIRIKAQKEAFEKNKRIYESALLKFSGVDGWDVYNCSIPFMCNGDRLIFGRVERRNEWAASHVRLFKEVERDVFAAIPNIIFELEDPYIQKIKEEMVFGGTHVVKNGGKVVSYYGYFYRGKFDELKYFTTGPDFMKDIRIVELKDKRIGIFSRKRTPEEVYVGYTSIDSLSDLTMETIQSAAPIPFIEEGTWGGVNQAYLLSCGKIGCIAHYSYPDETPSKEPLQVYVNYSFVFDPEYHTVEDGKVIGTKSCYPSCPAKKPFLVDCVFTSGIVMRADGKCDLYSGVADIGEGRLTIDYPFQEYGLPVGGGNLMFNDSKL